MQINQNARLDPSQVISGGGGGGRGGMVIGGGAGIIIVILGLIFGFNPSDILGQGTSSSGNRVAMPQCTTGASVKTDQNCRWVAYVNAINTFWSKQMTGYTKIPTEVFSGQVSTGCGTATSAVGPFYCPVDKIVYIDPSFVDELLSQLKDTNIGPAAEAYVLGHEYGHHVSDLTGVLAEVQAAGNQTGASSPQVRLELQADCYAGVWLRNEASGSGSGIITGITNADLDQVVAAAKAVGDDHIELQMQGKVSPESWTHGSSAMRQHWVTTGFNSGKPTSCDTFSTSNLGG